jgi:hypothetical protein
MVCRILKTILVEVVFLFAALEAAEISINRIDEAYGWQRKTLTVSADSIVNEISSFDLTIAFPQVSALVYDVRPGLVFENCGWEYFNYRIIRADTVVTYLPDYPVHLLNVTGLASLSGNPPPICSGESISLFYIDLVLERTFHRLDKFLPFRFFWRDCSDNILVSSSGEVAFGALGVFENISPQQTHEPFNSAFPGYGFAPVACPPGWSTTVENVLNFVNSGISPAVVDSLGCEAGDVNLNGVYYEVADAVLFIEYFIRGLGVFVINPMGQIQQTDCNCDGYVLTVADVVCFVRNTTGNDQTYKIPVTAESSTFISSKPYGHSRIFTLTTDSDLALSYLKIRSKNLAELNPVDFRIDNQSFVTGQISDTIMMLLVDLKGNPVWAAGEHKIFEYAGSAQLEIEAWFVDMAVNESSFKLENAVLPENPELLQNYPNPFNPSTTIEFNLPANSNWQLEIYNIAGQLIRNYSGISSGLTKVYWDGSNSLGIKVASGAYFYKLVSNDITTTRKMLLLK